MHFYESEKIQKLEMTKMFCKINDLTHEDSWTIKYFVHSGLMMITHFMFEEEDVKFYYCTI